MLQPSLSPTASKSATRPVLTALAVVLAAAGSPAQAQDEVPTRMAADLGTIVVIGNQVILKRVPVTYANGTKTRLRDVTIDLSARDTTGVVYKATVTAEGPSEKASVAFIAGKYKNFDDGCEFEVEGAGVADGGRTNWNIRTLPATCTTFTTSTLQATFQTGPILGHRDEKLIKSATCTLEGPSLAYGVFGSNGRYNFDVSGLMRITRIQNGLTIEDVNNPTCAVENGPVVLTYCPGDVCEP